MDLSQAQRPWRDAPENAGTVRWTLPAFGAGLITATIGAAVLVGWTLDIPILKRPSPGVAAMKSDTAAALVLLGVSLMLRAWGPRSALVRRLALAGAILPALLGLLSLGAYLCGRDWGMDRLLIWPHPGVVDAMPLARMTPAAAMNVLLLSCALGLVGLRRAVAAAQMLVLFTGLAGLLCLMGYLYGAPASLGVGHAAPIAPSTAALFILLSLGVFLLQPSDGLMRSVTGNTMGGWLLRRAGPFVFAIPLVLGWLRVQGERHHYFDSPTGVVLMVFCVILLLLGLVWWTARSLSQMDTECRQTASALREAAQRYRELVDNLPVGVYCATVGPQGRVLTANRAQLAMHGYDALEEFQRVPLAQHYARPADRAAISQLLLTQGSVRGLEVRLKKKNGQCLWARLTADARRGTDGSVLFYGIIEEITELKQAEQAMQQARADADASAASLLQQSVLLRSIVDHIPENIFWKDRDSVYLGCGAHFARLAGLGDPRDIVGKTDFDMPWTRAQAEAYRAGDRQVIASGQAALHIEETQLTGDGSRIHIDTSKVPLRSADGRIVGVLGIYADDTERKRKEETLAQNKEAMELLLASTSEAIVGVDIEGRCMFCNPAALRLLGYESPEELLGKNVHELIHHSDTDGKALPVEECRIRRAIREGKIIHCDDEVLWRRDGTSFPAEVWSHPQVRSGRQVGAVVTFLDITERKQMEEELRAAARTDKLTGLPNRALLCDRLGQAMWRAKRLKDYRYAVLFLDFDRFKTINDSLGHDVGDRLLQEIGRRLQATVRPSDSLSQQAPGHTSARLGGDEFVVLLDGIASADDAIRVANRLLKALCQPYRLDEHTVHATASVGIVTSDMAAGSADDVLCDADTAMYEAKLAGKGRYVVFDVSMRQRVENRLNLENDLHGALDAGQLFLLYQPIVSLRTGAIESYEALVRWRHPVRGVIAPGDFIPIAEETGMILSIGAWVLREACTQFARWRRDMGSAAPPEISVNLSRHQLVQRNFAATLQQVLDQTGVDPACLHLEVTESAVMRDPVTATQALRAIKDMGVKLDMDDFGTGYSSLACLHQFALDVLKIDRSFIANIDRGRGFAALVAAVTQLAHNLDFSVVAEGVETLDQVLLLQSLDCEFGQGYFFSKPLTAAAVTTFRVPLGRLPGQAA